jgi:hypothetical protein
LFGLALVEHRVEGVVDRRADLVLVGDGFVIHAVATDDVVRANDAVLHRQECRQVGHRQAKEVLWVSAGLWIEREQVEVTAVLGARSVGRQFHGGSLLRPR